MRNKIIIELKNKIAESLSPLINKDYYLLEVPYYTNIGDTLIWQGELDFLKLLPYNCKGMYALESFKFPKLKEDNLILFQGGGNFGDLWPKHHDFKMEVIAHYPKNKFLFFPQTVYFEKDENLKSCAEFLSHYDVTICARDKESYKILTQNFSNKIVLVPDMAFCIDMDCWKREFVAKRPLLLKRTDKELYKTKQLQSIELLPEIDITDWPTMQTNRDVLTKIMNRIKRYSLTSGRLTDLFAYYIYRPHLIHVGVKLLNTHTHIYTTRLHAAILGVLLDKPITFIDNSYGKNSSFYSSWLVDYDKIKLLEND